MQVEIFSGVAVTAHQLVGYWGRGDRSAILPSLLAATIQPLSEQQVGISAGGLTLDCWVRLQAPDLVLGRSPFGHSPLYWTRRDGTLWFASHLRLLLPLLDRPQIDIAGLYGYSCFSYVPTPQTPVRGIQALPAGQELLWSLDRQQPVTISQHRWQQAPEQLTDETVAVEQLQNLLTAAVARQVADLGTDPVGVLLSGGLDSALTAALLVQQGLPVRAYTLDFGQYGKSEYPYAAQVAAHLQIPLVSVPVNPQTVKQAMDRTARALDLPYGDGVTVPLYLLCQAASQEVATIFNGEGGDQLFAGWTNKPLIAASVYGSPAACQQQYLQTFHRLYGYADRVFQSPLLAQIQSLDPTNWIGAALDPTLTPDLLHRLRRASLLLKGAQNIHPRAANLANWHGLNVRSLFCDLPLATWTFGIAGPLYLQGSCEKYILKRAVANLLPSAIVWRSKRGMGVPLTPWIWQGWWSDIGSWLNPRALQAAGHWQPDIAARLVGNQMGSALQGRRMGEVLWLIVMWERWRSQVLGQQSPGYSWHHPFWWPQPLWQLKNSLLPD